MHEWVSACNTAKRAGCLVTVYHFAHVLLCVLLRLGGLLPEHAGAIPISDLLLLVLRVDMSPLVPELPSQSPEGRNPVTHFFPSSHWRRGSQHPRARRAAPLQLCSSDPAALFSRCPCWLLSPCCLWLFGTCQLAGSVSIRHVLYWYQIVQVFYSWVSCSAKLCKCLLHLRCYFYQLSLSSHQRIFDKTCFQETTAVMHLGTSENMPGIWVFVYHVSSKSGVQSPIIVSFQIYGVFLSFYCWQWISLRVR